MLLGVPIDLVPHDASENFITWSSDVDDEVLETGSRHLLLVCPGSERKRITINFFSIKYISSLIHEVSLAKMLQLRARLNFSQFLKKFMLDTVDRRPETSSYHRVTLKRLGPSLTSLNVSFWLRVCSCSCWKKRDSCEASQDNFGILDKMSEISCGSGSLK